MNFEVVVVPNLEHVGQVSAPYLGRVRSFGRKLDPCRTRRCSC